MTTAIDINKTIVQGPKSTATSHRPETPIGGDKEMQGLENACAEFESLFIYYILKEMRASMPKGGYLGKSLQSETYTSLFDMQLAKEFSHKGIGLTEFMKQQLENRFKEIQAQPAEKSVDFD